jgi:hypothetical protein
MLMVKGRITLDRAVDAWVSRARAHPRTTLLPVDDEVAVAAALLLELGQLPSRRGRLAERCNLQWRVLSDEVEVTVQVQNGNVLTDGDRGDQAVEQAAPYMGPIASRRSASTSSRTQQPARWSLTMPQACIEA